MNTLETLIKDIKIDDNYLGNVTLGGIVGYLLTGILTEITQAGDPFSAAFVGGIMGALYFGPNIDIYNFSKLLCKRLLSIS